MSNCSSDCTCDCGVPTAAAQAFDNTLAEETKLTLTVDDILRPHAGRYLGPSLDGPSSEVRGLNLDSIGGLYTLWTYRGYCGAHNREHLTAQYIGKAGSSIGSRLREHRHLKQLSDEYELSTEITTLTGPNRIAKYLEQAFLDHFCFPPTKPRTSATHCSARISSLVTRQTGLAVA